MQPLRSSANAKGPDIVACFVKLKMTEQQCSLPLPYVQEALWQSLGDASSAVIAAWEAGSSVSNRQLTQATAANNMMASSFAASVQPASGCGSCCGRSHWLALLSLTKVK